MNKIACMQTNITSQNLIVHIIKKLHQTYIMQNKNTTILPVPLLVSTNISSMFYMLWTNNNKIWEKEKSKTKHYALVSNIIPDSYARRFITSVSWHASHKLKQGSCKLNGTSRHHGKTKCWNHFFCEISLHLMSRMLHLMSRMPNSASNFRKPPTVTNCELCSSLLCFTLIQQ